MPKAIVLVDDSRDEICNPGPLISRSILVPQCHTGMDASLKGTDGMPVEEAGAHSKEFGGVLDTLLKV